RAVVHRRHQPAAGRDPGRRRVDPELCRNSDERRRLPRPSHPDAHVGSPSGLRRGRRPLPRLCPGTTRASARTPRVVMRTIDFRTAVREALDEELAADNRVIFFGEDVAVAGGVFAVTPGLYEKYGKERVFDTPISELALAGAAFGAAVSGLRPIIEIMFG